MATNNSPVGDAETDVGYETSGGDANTVISNPAGVCSLPRICFCASGVALTSPPKAGATDAAPKATSPTNLAMCMNQTLRQSRNQTGPMESPTGVYVRLRMLL